MFRAWYKFFIFVKEIRKETYPAPPFCAPGLSPSLIRKTGRFGTLPSAPNFPRGKELRAGSRIVIFLIFANFGPRKIGYQRCFRPEKRQNGKKNGNLRLHTTHLQQARQRGEWRHSEAGGWGGATRGRVRTHHAPRFQALTLFAEYPVQAGVRCGGEAACGAAARRIDSGAHQDWHVCVQVGMRCVRHRPCGMVC